MTSFVVVGFVMIKRDSIGCKTLHNVDVAGYCVAEMLKKDADVIIVRRVRD
jgi:hypothetical protein